MEEKWVTINGNHVLINDDSKKLDYQGKNGGSGKATSTGKTADTVIKEVRKWEEAGKNSVVIENNKKGIDILEEIKGDPEAKITVYRATPGDSINDGDWVFIDREHAERWTKTPFGSPKPNFKVVEMETKAKNVEWTGKNLEFAFRKNGVENDY